MLTNASLMFNLIPCLFINQAKSQTDLHNPCGKLTLWELINTSDNLQSLALTSTTERGFTDCPNIHLNRDCYSCECIDNINIESIEKENQWRGLINTFSFSSTALRSDRNIKETYALVSCLSDCSSEPKTLVISRLLLGFSTNITVTHCTQICWQWFCWLKTCTCN